MLKPQLVQTKRNIRHALASYQDRLYEQTHQPDCKQPPVQALAIIAKFLCQLSSSWSSPSWSDAPSWWAPFNVFALLLLASISAALVIRLLCLLYKSTMTSGVEASSGRLSSQLVMYRGNLYGHTHQLRYAFACCKLYCPLQFNNLWPQLSRKSTFAKCRSWWWGRFVQHTLSNRHCVCSVRRRKQQSIKNPKDAVSLSCGPGNCPHVYTRRNSKWFGFQHTLQLVTPDWCIACQAYIALRHMGKQRLKAKLSHHSLPWLVWSEQLTLAGCLLVNT